MLETRYGPAYKMVTPEDRVRWIERNGPYMLHSDPNLIERLSDVLPPEHSEAMGQLDPQRAPSRWVSEIKFDGREFTGSLLYLGERLVDGQQAFIHQASDAQG